MQTRSTPFRSGDLNFPVCSSAGVGLPPRRRGARIGHPHLRALAARPARQPTGRSRPSRAPARAVPQAPSVAAGRAPLKGGGRACSWSPQLQRREPNRTPAIMVMIRPHDHHHLRFLPALQLVVIGAEATQCGIYPLCRHVALEIDHAGSSTWRASPRRTAPRAHDEQHDFLAHDHTQWCPSAAPTGEARRRRP